MKSLDGRSTAHHSHPKSTPKSVAAFTACAFAAQIAVAPQAYAEDRSANERSANDVSADDRPDDDNAHAGISGSAGLDAFAGSTPGVDAGGALRPHLEGEVWLGWTARRPESIEAFPLFPGPALDRRRGLILAADAAAVAAARSSDGGAGRQRRLGGRQAAWRC